MEIDRILEIAGMIWFFSLITFAIKSGYDYLFNKKK